MQVLSKSQQDFLEVLSQRVVPEIAGLNRVERWRFLEIIDETLASRPRGMQHQFKLFLTMLRFSTWPRYRRRLDRLDSALQDATLRRLQDHPNGLLRRGFWGLKTLIFMGYYGQEEIGPRVNYRPVIKGNERLHDR